MLAEENPHMAHPISLAIQHRFHTLSPNDPARLPTLYLVDSILKNLAPRSPVWTAELGHLLPRWFVDTYQAQAGEQMRLGKLLGTWRDMPLVFAGDWIRQIDEMINVERPGKVCKIWIEVWGIKLLSCFMPRWFFFLEEF